MSKTALRKSIYKDDKQFSDMIRFNGLFIIVFVKLSALLAKVTCFTLKGMRCYLQNRHGNQIIIETDHI